MTRLEHRARYRAMSDRELYREIDRVRDDIARELDEDDFRAAYRDADYEPSIVVTARGQARVRGRRSEKKRRRCGAGR